MPARPILLALVWHMHQPSYRDPRSGRSLLPWTRLHATKDYRDMVDLLRAYPRVRCTFNLTPVLLDQLERIAAGDEDEALRLARMEPAALMPEDRAALLRDFFSVHRERMLEPRPRYRELLRRAGEERSGGAPLTEAEVRDLQVWFHLAWTDPSYAAEEPLRSLLAKGEGYTEAEKQALLDWGRALAGTVIPAYREASTAGQIEIAASAHYHPILPLLADSDAPREAGAAFPLPDPPFRAPEEAEAQLKSARASHARRFGAPPRGTWPPEGAVNDAALGLIRAQGFTWAASDETVLRRALAKEDGIDPPDWPAARCRPYRVETAAGPLAMVFRDRALSDRIGFVYQRWDAVEAAEDFIEQIRSSAAHAKGSGPALVTVILDGENCWEGYEEDGRPFLEALYERLEAHPSIEAVTVSQALELMPPSETLAHVPVGSWIRDDLAIWIGHPEKNAAWCALRDARALLAARGGDAPADVHEALQAAEGSDWFWWYGDDHESDHKDVFDALFRGLLLGVYASLGVEPPAALRQSLRAAADQGEGEDGPEWVGAPRYEAAGASGSMHRVSGVLERIRWRIRGDDLLVRIRLVPGASREGAVLRLAAGERSGRIPLDGADRGALAWEDGSSGGSYERGEAVDVRIPLALLPEGRRAWRLEVGRGEAVEERAPHEGWFDAAGPSGAIGDAGTPHA
ncbi:MAG TPA: glycoside hydrolase family 57 protein [Candidatus Omnitrophota bacterium]|nr:glycoside hydrolase family 57 protein [Candidatus Omnitrophota bacterium]